MAKKAEWNLAGVVDEQGNLEWPISGAGWAVPAYVEIKGKHLRWRWIGEGEKPAGLTYVQPGPGMLTGYLRIAKDVGRVESYARKWGTLQICHMGNQLRISNHQQFKRPAKPPKSHGVNLA